MNDGRGKLAPGGDIRGRATDRNERQTTGRSRSRPRDRIAAPIIKEPVQTPEDAEYERKCGEEARKFFEHDTNPVDIHAFDVKVTVKGAKAPPAAESFEDMGLGARMLATLKKLKYDRPTPVQAHAIPAAMKGLDVVACAHTGSGKTAAYLLPAYAQLLQDHGQSEKLDASRPLVLVLVPTRELCNQVYEMAVRLAFQTNLRQAVLIGGDSEHGNMRRQLDSLADGCHVVVATPGRLYDLVTRRRLMLDRVRTLVLDEADRMLGDENGGFYQQICEAMNCGKFSEKGIRQVLLFSATFPPRVRQLVDDVCSEPVWLTLGDMPPPNIKQHVTFATSKDSKMDKLLDLLQMGNNAQTLVFVATKMFAHEVADFLVDKHYEATALHADKSQASRERALSDFCDKVKQVLVATDVAARGLDIPEVAHVVQVDLPSDKETYVHRVGRTGRAGRQGLATAIYTERDRGLAGYLVQVLLGCGQDVPDKLYAEAGLPPPGHTVNGAMADTSGSAADSPGSADGSARVGLAGRRSRSTTRADEPRGGQGGYEGREARGRNEYSRTDKEERSDGEEAVGRGRGRGAVEGEGEEDGGVEGGRGDLHRGFRQGRGVDVEPASQGEGTRPPRSRSAPPGPRGAGGARFGQAAEDEGRNRAEALAPRGRPPAQRGEAQRGEAHAGQRGGEARVGGVMGTQGGSGGEGRQPAARFGAAAQGANRGQESQGNGTRLGDGDRATGFKGARGQDGAANTGSGQMGRRMRGLMVVGGADSRRVLVGAGSGGQRSRGQQGPAQEQQGGWDAANDDDGEDDFAGGRNGRHVGCRGFGNEDNRRGPAGGRGEGYTDRLSQHRGGGPSRQPWAGQEDREDFGGQRWPSEEFQGGDKNFGKGGNDRQWPAARGQRRFEEMQPETLEGGPRGYNRAAQFGRDDSRGHDGPVRPDNRPGFGSNRVGDNGYRGGADSFRGQDGQGGSYARGDGHFTQRNGYRDPQRNGSGGGSGSAGPRQRQAGGAGGDGHGHSDGANYRGEQGNRAQQHENGTQQRGSGYGNSSNAFGRERGNSQRQWQRRWQ